MNYGVDAGSTYPPNVLQSRVVGVLDDFTYTRVQERGGPEMVRGDGPQMLVWKDARGEKEEGRGALGQHDTGDWGKEMGGVVEGRFWFLIRF